MLLLEIASRLSAQGASRFPGTRPKLSWGDLGGWKSRLIGEPGSPAPTTRQLRLQASRMRRNSRSQPERPFPRPFSGTRDRPSKRVRTAFSMTHLQPTPTLCAKPSRLLRAEPKRASLRSTKTPPPFRNLTSHRAPPFATLRRPSASMKCPHPRNPPHRHQRHANNLSQRASHGTSDCRRYISTQQRRTSQSTRADLPRSQSAASSPCSSTACSPAGYNITSHSSARRRCVRASTIPCAAIRPSFTWWLQTTRSSCGPGSTVAATSTPLSPTAAFRRC